MKNIVLSLIACLILLSPVVIHFFSVEEISYQGTDNQGSALVNELQPEYKPWFSLSAKALPPALENMLFTLQAVIGASILFYIIGYYKGKKAANRQ